MSDTIAAFFAAWGETDDTARKRTLERILAPHFTYADPMGSERIAGAAAMSDFLHGFTAKTPDAGVRVVRVDAHHRFARVAVDFSRDADTPMMRGQYFIDTDEDGRLTLAVGFSGMGAPE